MTRGQYLDMRGKGLTMRRKVWSGRSRDGTELINGQVIDVQDGIGGNSKMIVCRPVRASGFEVQDGCEGVSIVNRQVKQKIKKE